MAGCLVQRKLRRESAGCAVEHDGSGVRVGGRAECPSRGSYDQHAAGFARGTRAARSLKALSPHAHDGLFGKPALRHGSSNSIRVRKMTALSMGAPPDRFYAAHDREVVCQARCALHPRGRLRALLSVRGQEGTPPSLRSQGDSGASRKGHSRGLKGPQPLFGAIRPSWVALPRAARYSGRHT